MVSVHQPAQRTVEFGIYRDGDNNLDISQGITLRQALQTSSEDSRIQYTVQDTTAAGNGKLRTDSFAIADGAIAQAQIEQPHNMASEENLARFVAHVLDNAEAAGAKETWIELVDHGAGDGGGLEADSARSIMSMPDMAQAFADGMAMHARAHPEDSDRKVDGVVANECLMGSLGFADALYHAGVHYLAASPETMVSPGVPSNVAEAIAAHSNDARAMAAAMVNDVMNQKYGMGNETWRPAAAFDVLDLDGEHMRAIERSVREINDAIVAQQNDKDQVAAIRQDARSVTGMVRFSDATPDMPWHSDRPALDLYDTFSRDARLSPQLRQAATHACAAVRSSIIAHKESDAFAPFGGADYSDAAGPTVHFPIKGSQIDPWAPRVSETKNRFFDETHAGAAERVIA